MGGGKCDGDIDYCAVDRSPTASTFLRLSLSDGRD